MIFCDDNKATENRVYNYNHRSTEIEPYFKISDNLGDRLDLMARSLANGNNSAKKFLNFAKKYRADLKKNYPLKPYIGRLALDNWVEQRMHPQIMEELGKCFALHYALDSFRPDVVMPILHGAANLGAVSEFFGHTAILVEAHRPTSDNFTGEEFRQISPGLVTPKNKVLILEDNLHMDSADRTYNIVKDQLRAKGIKDDNVAIFIDYMDRAAQRCGVFPWGQDENPKDNMKIYWDILNKDNPYFYEDFSHNAPHHKYRLLQELKEQGNLEESFESFRRKILD